MTPEDIAAFRVLVRLKTAHELESELSEGEVTGVREGRVFLTCINCGRNYRPAMGDLSMAFEDACIDASPA